MTDATPEELIEILKGPYLMKDLCSNYDKSKGKKHFENFHDNGICDEGEIDWFYSGSIDHLYDGDFYTVQCCVRDPWDRSESVNPSVTFLTEFVGFRDRKFDIYPKMEDFIVMHDIRSPTHFNEVMSSWPSFVKDSLERVEAHRKSWEDYLSPAPDTKELYYFVKNFLAHDIKNSTDDIINFRKVKQRSDLSCGPDYYDDEDDEDDEDYEDELMP